MKVKIVDASVAIKWFVYESMGANEAAALLNEIEVSPKYFAVPELFFNEMLAVFCRLVTSDVLILEYMDTLQNLGFMRIENGREVITAAVRIAKKHGLTGYDAIYAANAQLTDGIWITADKTAHSRLVKLGISRLL